MNKKSSQPVKIIGLIIFTLICLHTIASSVSGWVDDNNTIYSTTEGKVGIGANDPDTKLTIAGAVHARQVIVDSGAGADFVFEDDYDLAPLAEIGPGAYHGF
jgi:hypothetical protein